MPSDGGECQGRIFNRRWGLPHSPFSKLTSPCSFAPRIVPGLPPRTHSKSISVPVRDEK